ncbi:MAG: Ig-like domain-containing protein [Desulfuromusa sp.]|nr:Ig-like domain-containing protein [Desulfuromusa sp.]
MRKNIAIHISLFAMSSLLLLSACGGGGGGGDDSGGSSRAADDGTSATVTALTGTVADGYLTDALVFLDRNKNRVYDNGEPMAHSTAGGRYTLEANPGEGELYSVVAQVVAGQTIDEDTGSSVPHNYSLETLPGRWGFVSPLTTLTSLECAKNPSSSVQQAEISVRTQLGIADSVSLFTDYIAPDSVGSSSIEEYGRAHRAGQVVAAIMGSLRASIADNLNDPEQSLVALMVADQVMGQATLIEQALNNARNDGSVIDVSELTTTISAGIDTGELDMDLLDRYKQRLADQNFETWDMQPPRVQDQSPPEGDTSSVDAIVSISFDEPLDETLLTNGIIELAGPNGLVSGSLDYDAETIRLTFTPSQLLMPFSNYQATVNKVLADTLGNPLGNDITWGFTTIFDQVPPSLPDF